MGLLERALKYKKQLNETGKETLIDRIKGPAESGFNERPNSETVDFYEIDDDTLPSISEISTDESIINIDDYVEDQIRMLNSLL